jgi:hypothetical protein
MIPIRAVSEDTINSANSLTDILGLARSRIGGLAMDQILASANLGGGRSIHIGTLSRQTIIESGAEHLGLNGYFVFEAADTPTTKGIVVLGKACSIEAALRLIDIWEAKTTAPSRLVESPIAYIVPVLAWTVPRRCLAAVARLHRRVWSLIAVAVGRFYPAPAQ